MSNIITTFPYLVKDNDLFGRDILRSDKAGLPLAFRPTIEHVTRQSANKNNNNQTIEALVPEVRIIDGLAVSTDSWKATFKFTALQHIESEVNASLAFDMIMAYCAANKAAIIAGLKPASSAPFVLTQVSA